MSTQNLTQSKALLQQEQEVRVQHEFRKKNKRNFNRLQLKELNWLLHHNFQLANEFQKIKMHLTELVQLLNLK